jgi:hypothetical protein
MIRKTWLLGALSLAAVAAARPFGEDPDAWWHLEIGRYIGVHGIPTVEPFAYSPAAHAWVGQQWLYEVLLAHTVFGGAGGLAVLVMALVGAAAFLLAGLSTPRDVPAFWVAAAIVLCAFSATEVLGVRGQVVTVLGTGIVVWILGKWRRGDNRVVWLLPPLLLLWCNLHAGFITGLALCLLYAVMPRRRSWGLNGDRRPLLAALAVAAAVTLINPAGWNLYPYVLDTFTNPVITQSIAEWQSPDFHSQLIHIYEFTAFLLVVLWVTSREVEWSDVAVAMLTIAASLQAQRNIALFAVVATPQIARYGHASYQRLAAAIKSGPLPALLRSNHRLGPYGSIAATPIRAGRVLSTHPFVTALALLVCVFYVSAQFVLPIVAESDNGTYEARHEPEAAATYYSEHYGGERVYATYDRGGYLVYRFPTGRVVDIYGESGIFGSRSLSAYLDIALLTSNWVKLLQGQMATHAIVPAHAAEVGAFRELGWRVDCYDAAGYVLMTAHPRLPSLTYQAPPAPELSPRC